MTKLEKAREFFSNDRYATVQTAIEILEVDDRYAKCALRINDNHKNALGNVMGGVSFTLADFVFAVATNFEAPYPTVTASSHISYLGAPKGDTLIGESKLIKDGQRVCVYQVSINDNLGNAVALVCINGVHLN